MSIDDGHQPADAAHIPELQVNVNVDREILNHRLLVHPHIIRFHEVSACTMQEPVVLIVCMLLLV